MLKLSNVWSLNINQWGIWVDYTVLYQISQWQNISWYSLFFQPSFTETQRVVVLADVIVECFRTSGDLDISWKIKVFHVMRTISLLFDVTSTCRSECFDGIKLTFLHFDVRISFSAWNSFSTMNFVAIDWVSIKILYNLHLMNFTVNFDFIRLHSLLNFLTNIWQSCINSCFFNTCVGCILNGQKKIVINCVESDSKGSINDSTFNVSTEINLTHIVIF